MKSASRPRASGITRRASWRAPPRARCLTHDAIGRLHRRRPRRGSEPLLGPRRPEQPPHGLSACGSAGAQPLRVALPPPPPPQPPPSRAVASIRCDLKRLPSRPDAPFLLCFGSCSSYGWLCSCIMSAGMMVGVQGHLFRIVCCPYVAPRPKNGANVSGFRAVSNNVLSHGEQRRPPLASPVPLAPRV